MKTGKYNSFSPLRRQFKNIAEMSDVINRGPNYIVDRLKGIKPFTEREKRMLLVYLHEDAQDPAAIAYYFGGADNVPS